MKKILLSLASVAIASAAALAQNHDYNRAGISYNNTHFGYNKELGGKENNFSGNGFGIDYVHGFSLSSKLPMFIETGLSFNMGFSSKSWDKEEYSDGTWYEDKTIGQNINLTLPVNFVYRFNVTDGFSIAPFAGINLKLHLSERFKEKCDSNDPDYKEESEWYSVFDKKEMGEDGTFNRFQMGWQVGCGFQYKPLYLGISYGTDFIPAYKYEKEKINTGNLKVSVAYCF